MKRLKLKFNESKTIAEGFEEFIYRCNYNNLRPATIKHYKESWKQISKCIDVNMGIGLINEQTFENAIINIKKVDNRGSQTIYSYSRDLKTIINFFIKQGYLAPFKMELPKVDQKPIEPYTDEEIQKLINKPDKKCSFTQYRNWCITCFILSTGLRLSSVINVKIKDINLPESIVYVKHTKNRKSLIIPLNKEINKILREWFKVRQYNSIEDYLFCNVYGKQLSKSAIVQALNVYNKQRGVETTGIHRLRHTFAKQWILSGNSVVTLQQILGHSSLEITQNYVNLMITDLENDVNNNNILMKFSYKYMRK